MCERMDIAESIYEGVVEPSYKLSTGSDATHAGHSRKKRGEVASSHTYSKMSERVGKRRKRYVDYLTGKSKTCLIHGPSHSSYECKVLRDFGSKYVKIIHTTYKKEI